MATERALTALIAQHGEIDAMVSLDISGEPSGVVGPIEDPGAVSVATIESLESIQCALGLLGLGQGHTWSISTDERGWYVYREGEHLLVAGGPRQANPASVLARVFDRRHK